ncbi:putative pentatricopeptide repeat-containing protein [Glycine soja]
MLSISHSSLFRLHSAASITTLLKASKKSEHLKQMQACVIHHALEQDHFLVSLFISCAHTLLSTFSHAFSIFYHVLALPTLLWNTLVKSHCQKNLFSHTLSVFARMKAHGELPYSFTYPFVIKAYSGACKVREGKLLHGFAFLCSIDHDLYKGPILINMYRKCREIADACKVFHGMSVGM